MIETTTMTSNNTNRSEASEAHPAERELLSEKEFEEALRYEKGKGVEKDMKKAFEWFLKSAENGNAKAMNNVGCCFSNGEGVKQDMTKAFEWWLRSAENGNTNGMNNVGWCHCVGQGVEKDLTKAFEGG